MKIERQQIGTVDVFTPVGALVEAEAEDFSKLLLERVRLPNARVVVSMREVPYLDSGAIEGLLEATEELADRAAGLKLASVPQTCREILELTGVSARFSFFEEVQDAVRSFL
jgi:anti-anti-sigma factor